MDQRHSNSLLVQHDLKQFWYGQLAASLGSRVTREGLPIVAIATISATAAEVGLMAALATLPALLLGNLWGQWVDRNRRQPLLIYAGVARAAFLMVIPLLYLLHRLNFPALAIITVLTAATGVLSAIATHAYLPFLATRSHLEAANQLIEMADSIGETGGPGIMGLLIQSIGAPFALLFDAGASLTASALYSRIRRREVLPPSELPHFRPARRPFMEVWKLVARHAILRPLWLNAGASAFFDGFFSALYAFYALKTLHLSPLLLGMLITLGGLGSLAGTRLYPHLRRRWSLTQVILLGYCAYALLNIAIPWAHGSLGTDFTLLLVAQFGGDLFATTSQISASTVEQESTPDHWLGQVRGTFHALSGGTEVLGALMAGFLTLFISVRGVLWIAVCGLIAASLLLMNPRFRHFSTKDFSTALHQWP